VKAELKQQTLQAAASCHIQVLEDPGFGCSDVSPQAAMLQHLKDTACLRPSHCQPTTLKVTAMFSLPTGTLTNVCLWVCLCDCQALAPASAPINNGTAIHLTLGTLERTGVFSSLAINKWGNKALANQTLDNFMRLFTFEKKERNCKLATKTAGFHGAHQATAIPSLPHVALAAVRPPVAPAINTKMRCCHTHGLGKTSCNTSATCSHPDANHKTDATVTNMMGGSNCVAICPPCQRPNACCGGTPSGPCHNTSDHTLP
jgi:hypothetical protein